jgi:hypothetical protein
MKMANLKNIRKWVKMLRSGKYKQITRQLCSNDGYCCLGVACLGAGMKQRANRFGAEVDVLPNKAMRWLGIDEGDPMLIGSGADEHALATALNDIKKYSFQQIADAIERTYLKAKNVV